MIAKCPDALEPGLSELKNLGRFCQNSALHFITGWVNGFIAVVPVELNLEGQGKELTRKIVESRVESS